MTTNYERIKNMTVDEMAMLNFVEFYIRQKDGTNKKYYVSYNGKPCDSLEKLREINKEWLQQESE